LAIALSGHATDDDRKALLRSRREEPEAEGEGGEAESEGGEEEGASEESGPPSTIRYEKTKGESTAERITPVHESEKEEGEKAEGEGEEGEGVTGPAVAVLMMASILFTPVVMEFAAGGGIRAKLTLRMLEAFITIFVAVMWFSVFDKLLHVAGLEDHHIVLAGILNVCFLFLVATLVSWAFRRSDMAIAIFLACGAHFVGFAACHLSGHVHMHVFPGRGQSWMYLLVTVATALFLSVALYGLRKVLGYAKYRDYEEKYDEFENDVIALTISYSAAQIVKFVAVGEVNHFNNAHKSGGGEEFMQFGREEEEESHSATQRLIMFGFAVVSLGLSMFVPEAKESASWFTKKALDITQAALMMSGAWGFLLAFHWEFYETVFPGVGEESDLAIFAGVVFAVAMTAVALVTIQALSLAGVRNGSVVARSIPLAVALGAAFAWEEAFDLGVEIMVDKYQFFPKSEGLGVNLVLAILSAATLVPTYAKHIKPKLMD